MLQSESNQVTETKPAETDWRGLYKLGAFTALMLIVLPPAEIIVGLLPGANGRRPARSQLSTGFLSFTTIGFWGCATWAC